MKIQIDGTNVLNKGAELMLYAVLEQIEKKYPDSEILYNSIGDGYDKFTTSLKVKSFLRLRYGFYTGIILSKLNMPYSYFTNYYPIKGVDIMLDASGFRLGDQWNRDEKYLDTLESYYKKQKEYGSKIILLSQALGPFKTDSGKRTADILNKYVDLVFAREEVSYQYLLDAGFDKNKVDVSPDFTNLVKGNNFEKFENLKDKVCIIPNKKMLTHTSLDSNNYINCLKILIQYVIDSKREVFLLNHEGEGDLKLCNLINDQFDNKLEVVTDLNAKEIKAVIKQSHFTFSSRYHGVASSLSQGIPCIATSWSHKYKLLFKDYDLSGYIVDVNSDEKEIKKIVSDVLDDQKNTLLRKHIVSQQSVLENKSKAMWEKVWKTI